MTTINITMTDFFTGEKILRVIDGSLFAMPTVVKSKTEQRNRLEDWIETRGNEQHNTTLELQSWIWNK